MSKRLIIVPVGTSILTNLRNGASYNTEWTDQRVETLLRGISANAKDIRTKFNQRLDTPKPPSRNAAEIDSLLQFFDSHQDDGGQTKILLLHSPDHGMLCAHRLKELLEAGSGGDAPLLPKSTKILEPVPSKVGRECGRPDLLEYHGRLQGAGAVLGISGRGPDGHRGVLSA